MMMVSDLTAVLATGMIFTLNIFGVLQFWHLYIASILYGLGNTFQWPAYSAAISTMIPKEQYSRANGLMSLMEAGPGVLAPILAGVLYPMIGLTGLLGIDVATFFIAISALAVITIPKPQTTDEGEKARGGMLKESWAGIQYIFQRPTLLGLQLIFLFGNLFTGIGFAVQAPMILARTDQNSLIFGSVQTAGAIGGIIGGILMSSWEGFKNRSRGVLIGWSLVGISAMGLLGIGRGLTLWIPAMIISGILNAMINTSNQAFWQAKVAPDLQGRVFSSRRLIAWISQPVAPLIGGALADFVLEPAMNFHGALAPFFGWLVGTGPGAGMGLLFVFCGLLVTLIGISGFFFPALRNAD
jgi:MFS family permease